MIAYEILFGIFSQLQIIKSFNVNSGELKWSFTIFEFIPSPTISKGSKSFKKSPGFKVVSGIFFVSKDSLCLRS